MEKLTSVRSEQILGKGNYEYALPFYHERHPILIDYVLNKDPAVAARYPYIKREGKTIFSESTIPHFNDGRGAVLWITASPLYDSRGNITGAIESTRDITDRKRAEDRIRRSEERYRSVVEDQTEFISRFLPDGTHVFVNDAFCRYFGLKREEIIGHRFQPEILAEDKEQLATFYSSLTPENPVGTIVYRIIMPDNRTRWQRWNAHAFFKEDGSITEFQSVGQDITETKEAEEALRESERMLIGNQVRLANAMDLAHMVNWEFDVRTGIFTFDRRFYALYATTPEREGGTQMPAEVYVREFVHPDDAKEAGRVIREAIENKNPSSSTQMEHRIIRRDGQIRDIIVRFSIINDEKGEIIGTYGVNQDITDRKRSEAALIQSLREKELLLKEIHHRVKNNLQTISSILYIQSRSTENPEEISLLVEARSRVISMGLIHQKLYQSADIAHIPFTDFIRSLIDFLEETYGVDPEKISTVVDVSPPDLTMDLDSGIPCGLIINELVTNALKYAFPGRNIGKIRITLNLMEDRYVLSVSDDGVGIPADLDLSTVRSLGMTIITSLTHQLDGKLEIIRQPGTTTIITFPRVSISGPLTKTVQKTGEKTKKEPALDGTMSIDERIKRIRAHHG